MKITLGKHRFGPYGDSVEVGFDYARCKFGEITPEDLYESLKAPVLKAIEAGPAKVRDLSRSITWNGKKPTKKDLEAAGRLFGLWSVNGPEVLKV